MSIVCLIFGHDRWAGNANRRCFRCQSQSEDRWWDWDRPRRIW